MSTAEFRLAAEEYVGLDLVSEVLHEEFYAGVNILDHAKMIARGVIESRDNRPEYFEKSINRITRDIADAQKRLLR